MKKIFAIFTAVILMPASQSMAWTGGPFSNGNALPGGDDGVYEAVATTSNGLGIYRFAVRNNGVSSETAGTGATGTNGATTVSSNVQFSAGLLAASSSNVWYYKGITYYGTAFGTVNSDAGIVACVGNATSNSPIIGGTQGQGGNTGTAFATGTGGTNGAVIHGPAGNNIGYANSSWLAKIKKRESPTLRFRGTGVVSFVGEATAVAEVEAINPTVVTPGGTFTPVTTVGGTANPTGNSLVTTSNKVNSTSTTSGGGTLNGGAVARQSQVSFRSSTRVSTGGEDSDFSQRGHSRKFVIFGSRVSASVAP
jgi:hypothetical protein